MSVETELIRGRMEKRINVIVQAVALALILWIGATVQNMSVEVAVIKQRLEDDPVNGVQTAELERLSKRVEILEGKR
jgi:cell division protein FtsB